MGRGWIKETFVDFLIKRNPNRPRRDKLPLLGTGVRSMWLSLRFLECRRSPCGPKSCVGKRRVNRRRGVVDTQMLLDLCLVDHVAQGLGGVVELGSFGVVETKLDDVAHAAAVEHGWGADVDVVEAVLALEKRRDW